MKKKDKVGKKRREKEMNREGAQVKDDRGQQRCTSSFCNVTHGASGGVMESDSQKNEKRRQAMK